MRALVLMLCLLLIPMASARPEVVEFGYDIQTPDKDCPECVGASAYVAQVEPDNCADCGGVWVAVGVESDEEGVTASAEVCRGGFVVICVVDEDVRI